jgi:hypothetical protein
VHAGWIQPGDCRYFVFFFLLAAIRRSNGSSRGVPHEVGALGLAGGQTASVLRRAGPITVPFAYFFDSDRAKLPRTNQSRRSRSLFFFIAGSIGLQARLIRVRSDLEAAREIDRQASSAGRLRRNQNLNL